MTQLAISDELARTIQAVAAECDCSPETLLRRLFESDAEFANRLVTPAIRQRILSDVNRDRSDFIASEEVDRKFEHLFGELEAR